MLESINTTSLEYKKLSEEEMKNRGILGRLVGPIADTVHATRNKRRYSNELWEAVFNNPIMKEKFDRGGVFGELGHPQDRQEVDMEKIALCMPEPPKKDKTGKLQAVFDILNTPCGKILKTLCDYGYKMGISSRGSGDTYIDNNGDESVDPSTYDCECFDAVLIPAVKEATLKLVTESIDSKVSLKKALAESLKSAKDDNDKKIMIETLDNLGIDYIQNKEEKDIIKLVSNNFGVTNEPFYGPTFILPNGYFLNIQKCKHHSDVEKWLIDNGYSTNEYNISAGSKTLDDLGCIRCDTTKYYIALSENQPTSEQYNSLLVWLDKLLEYKNLVEVITYDNQHIVYDLREITPDYVIDRIRHFYSSGVLYEKLNQKHQHNFIYKREKIGDSLKESISKNNISSTEISNIDVNNENIAVDDIKAGVVQSLQEALKKNAELEAKILNLQEKLSVCYAKEDKLQENVDSYKKSITDLSVSLRAKEAISNKVSLLEKKLNQKEEEIKKSNQLIEELRKENDKIKLSFKKNSYSLREDLSTKENEVELLNKKVISLNEEIASLQKNASTTVDKLNEEIAELKKDSLITSKSYSNKISKSNELVEKYKKIASNAVDKYIDLQANRLGLTSNEVKNRLPSNYSFNDIDSICESLQDYRVSISKLPFTVDSLNESMHNSQIKIEASSNKEPLLNNYSADDEIDSQLLSMLKP